MAEIVPPGFGPPPDDFHPLGGFEPVTPVGEPFGNPFNHEPNIVHVQPRASSRSYEQYNDDFDLGPRITTLDINDTPRNSSEKRKSILRRSSSSAAKVAPLYELHRLEKGGEDWNVAKSFPIPASPRDLEDKIKSGRRRHGLALEQLAEMKAARRGQIMRLLDELNDREKDSGALWEIASIEPRNVIENKSRGSRDIRAMDVVFRRTTKFGHPVETKSRSESHTERTVDLRDANKNKDKNKKDGKDKDKSGEGKSKSTMKDPDPFGSSKVFSSDGKPMDEYGQLPYENGGLPPHLPKDQPIGRLLPPRSKSRDKPAERQSGYFGEFGGDQPGVEIIPPPPGGPLDQGFDMAGVLNEPVRGRRDSGVEMRPPPRGSLSRRRSILRQQDRSRSRPPRSRSRPRVIYTNDARTAERLNHYFNSNSSVSSGDILRGELDEVLTDNTSEGIHEEAMRRGYSNRRPSSSKYDPQPESRERYRSSSKYSEQPYIRTHYRGPSIPASPTRDFPGEQFLVAQRRPTLAGGSRPQSYIQPSQMPLTRAITYGGHDLSPERLPLTPRTPMSPHRTERQVQLYYPTDLERDAERDANRYMSESVLREQELKNREYRVQRAEMELAARERQRRVDKGYFAPGGYNPGGGHNNGGHNLGGYSGGYNGTAYADGKYRY